MTQTGLRIKCDHFEILATEQSDIQIKESFLIRDLKPALNENVDSEKLLLYYRLLAIYFFPADLTTGLFIFIYFFVVITFSIEWDRP